MPEPTILIQDHREDIHSIDVAPYDDPEVSASGLPAARAEAPMDGLLHLEGSRHLILNP